MATTNSLKQHKLRKLIAYLSEKEGRGLEFVSLYIPKEASIHETIEILKNKSDSIVRKSENSAARLQHALKNIVQHLKQPREIPENGIAIFAGTYTGKDSETELLNIEEIVPPEPIVKYLLEINDHFLLEPLRKMLREPRIAGIIAMDSKEADFAILTGERLDLIQSITSGIPGKSGKGGQSQRRYERERDMELTSFYQRVAEHAAKTFLEDHRVTALIIGGPGPTKLQFSKSNHLHYVLKKLLLNIVDTQYVGKQGVEETLNKSKEALNSMCEPDERQVLRNFLEELDRQTGLAIYGLEQVLDALKNGEVETVFATDDTDMIEVVATCKKCGSSKTRMADKKQVQVLQEVISSPCERCGAIEYEVDEKDIIDVLEDAASQTDARVEVISTKSEERAKLAALGGFAALLRYKPG